MIKSVLGSVGSLVYSLIRCGGIKNMVDNLILMRFYYVS
jgi:hypothetical protein